MRLIKFRQPSQYKTLILVATVAGPLLWPGCSKSVEDVSFTGTWNISKENGISGQKIDATATVTVSGNRFRIESRDAETLTLDVYDGKRLTHRETDVRSDVSPELKRSPVVSVAEKTDIEVESMRFWKGTYPGTGIAGGQIAGRETVLFQVQEPRPDGTMTGQAWVDAENRVVLKRVFTIYSSQIEQVVAKTTEECQQIRFETVDDRQFTNAS